MLSLNRCNEVRRHGNGRPLTRRLPGQEGGTSQP
jgi:hypothetical protein